MMVTNEKMKTKKSHLPLSPHPLQKEEASRVKISAKSQKILERFADIPTGTKEALLAHHKSFCLPEL